MSRQEQALSRSLSFGNVSLSDTVVPSGWSAPAPRRVRTVRKSFFARLLGL